MRLPPSLVILRGILHVESLVLFFMEANAKNKLFYRPKQSEKLEIIFYSRSDFICMLILSY